MIRDTGHMTCDTWHKWDCEHCLNSLEQFSNIIVYVRVVRKMPNQCFHVFLFPNPGEKVQKRCKTTGQICHIIATRIRTLNSNTAIHVNVGPAFFHKPWYVWLCWKIYGKTFQRMVVFHSRGQDFSLSFNFMKPGS